MADWKQTLITADASVRRAIETIERNAQQICLVVDEKRVLVGTVTDGDVRRGILRGLNLDTPVAEVMNRAPHVAPVGADRASVAAMMKSGLFRQIPLVDADGCVAGLVHIHDLIAPAAQRANWVVLMAGGMGRRLLPMTETLPKPLLPVGDKPILDRIIDNFIDQGFRQFYLSVNYKADLIEERLGNGSSRNIEVRYLREDEPLGTAGALRLIKEVPSEPLIVMNADLMTNISFSDLLNFHHEQQAAATMAVREYNFQVPYGVVDIVDSKIRRIEEKPMHRSFVNAGIYVIDPRALEHIPGSARFDMPDLFSALIAANKLTSAFPVREYWLDIGHKDDFKRANQDYARVFDEGPG